MGDRVIAGDSRATPRGFGVTFSPFWRLKMRLIKPDKTRKRTQSTVSVQPDKILFCPVLTQILPCLFDVDFGKPGRGLSGLRLRLFFFIRPHGAQVTNVGWGGTHPTETKRE